MTDAPTDNDTCRVCNARSESAFGRIYERDRRITLCSPACVSAFLAGSPTKAINGNNGTADGYLARYMTEWRWRELGR